MHDAIEIEKLGKPAVVICTEEFRQGGEAMAKIRGFPGFPMVLVPHPIGVLDDGGLWERAESALPRVVDIATRGKA